MDRVHVSVDWPGMLGPPWTDGGADKGGRGTVARSRELGRRCGGRATVVQNREAAALGEDTALAWR
jgi:hypothetical protein